MTLPKTQFMPHKMDMATMATLLLRDHRDITSMVENVSQYSNSLVFSPLLSFTASEPAGQLQVLQHFDINT
jgi:hypothetical protein